MIDEYLASASNEVVGDIVICNPIVLYKHFKVNDSYELVNKVHNYLNIHKKEIEKISLPKNYMYGYEVKSSNYINPRKIEFVEDINLLINIFSKTIGNLYIPKRNLTINNRSFEKILIFEKKEFYGR